MCDEAFIDCLTAFKFILFGLLQVKYSFKNLIKSHLLIKEILVVDLDKIFIDNDDNFD